MYTVQKEFTFDASHNLNLPYESPCNRVHGHTYRCIVTCMSEDLNENGMVMDFALIKKLVVEKLDHRHLNDVLPFHTTAENMAEWICEQIPNCVEVELWESPTNKAIYSVID